MLISKENRKAIYSTLFREGVMVAKKDYEASSHPELPKVRNLEVIKALQSLTSRGYVKTQFNWQYYYYFLTDEGITYLREYLHLPAEVVPATFKRTAVGGIRGEQRQRGEGGRRFGGEGGRDGGYRRRSEFEKKESAPGSFRPEFR
ncbi:hypothetical protein MIR68_000023 [Amoeboaphelidium protococcarum]|nr:hypothetical protein MIR68_000023 [Amoeboaphelidium protococcarum]KAI3646807.1 hypothetical protein MP228_009735 [Amoeboaphelidium protococcarum]KAI3647164.1 hypothetical protein MP228_007385 [Amoeboaphelidium protococcarum]